MELTAWLYCIVAFPPTGDEWSEQLGYHRPMRKEKHTHPCKLYKFYCSMLYDQQRDCWCSLVLSQMCCDPLPRHCGSPLSAPQQNWTQCSWTTTTRVAGQGTVAQQPHTCVLVFTRTSAKPVPVEAARRWDITLTNFLGKQVQWIRCFIWRLLKGSWKVRGYFIYVELEVPCISCCPLIMCELAFHHKAYRTCCSVDRTQWCG